MRDHQSRGNQADAATLEQLESLEAGPGRVLLALVVDPSATQKTVQGMLGLDHIDTVKKHGVTLRQVLLPNDSTATWQALKPLALELRVLFARNQKWALLFIARVGEDVDEWTSRLAEWAGGTTRFRRLLRWSQTRRGRLSIAISGDTFLIMIVGILVLRAVLSVGSQPAQDVAAGSTPAGVPIQTGSTSICGEASRRTAPDANRFLRHEGVSSFTVANTKGAVLNDRVRAIAVDNRGLWLGYFSTGQHHAGGIGQYDKKTWADCSQTSDAPVGNINAIAIDQHGRIWVATESAGVAEWDGSRWLTHTTDQKLPSNETYGITVDSNSNIWVATSQGVAKFDGTSWSTPYTAPTLVSNRIHAIAFDTDGNIWVGHVDRGLSQYSASSGAWVPHRAGDGSLGGDNVRSIAVRPASATSPESVWIATADGGVAEYEQGTWTMYNETNGLPSSDAEAVAVDVYNRVWVATDKGVVYFDGQKWNTYNSLSTLSIAFGPKCASCPYDEQQVWTGTATLGAVNSRLPLMSINDGVGVVSVDYPHIVAPGQSFRITVTVSPRPGYELRQDRGDFLSNMDASDNNLFGAWPVIPVKGTISPGQPFTFTDYENPLKAPQLAEGVQEQTFRSTWRVWMHNRYVGPPIEIEFTVRRP